MSLWLAFAFFWHISSHRKIDFVVFAAFNLFVSFLAFRSPGKGIKIYAFVFVLLVMTTSGLPALAIIVFWTLEYLETTF